MENITLTNSSKDLPFCVRSISTDTSTDDCDILLKHSGTCSPYKRTITNTIHCVLFGTYNNVCT